MLAHTLTHSLSLTHIRLRASHLAPHSRSPSSTLLTLTNPIPCSHSSPLLDPAPRPVTPLVCISTASPLLPLCPPFVTFPSQPPPPPSLQPVQPASPTAPSRLRAGGMRGPPTIRQSCRGPVHILPFMRLCDVPARTASRISLQSPLPPYYPTVCRLLQPGPALGPCARLQWAPQPCGGSRRSRSIPGGGGREGPRTLNDL
ncbi:hypothetical protein LX36DRAFT_91380 [Colletotrichum falcatum]|nr:hypothetical protein LX36DRAFT_91380 [Colletotrichum falcatum]